MATFFVIYELLAEVILFEEVQSSELEVASL